MDEIHLWRISLPKAPCRQDWLNGQELERMRSFVDASAGKAHCVARTALRLLLGGYTEQQPEQIRLRILTHGKPALATSTKPLFFNLSHSGSWALMGFTRFADVGVDLELQRDVDDRERIARRVMGTEDVQILSADGFSQSLFTRMWTRFEACQKCLGLGVFGRKASEKELGVATFSAGGLLTGSVAWNAPDIEPTMRYFTLT
jgi:4'-phosphopantetheinyl transferase